MRKIIYYVAASLDGYIAGPNGDISRFSQGGPGVDRYLEDLKAFDTVLMGRKTYEFGYQFGLKPGEPAYTQMRNLVFSNTLEWDTASDGLEVVKPDLKQIDSVKKEEGADVYLCGGGRLAGWLLKNRRIDILKVKLNPVVLGAGTRIFGDSPVPVGLELSDSAVYPDIQILTYQILY